MVCKLKTGRLAYGIAMGALALTPLVAQAQDTSSTTGAMTGTMSSSTMGTTSSSSMMQPMPLTGTVLRYYVDRSGYVSAADVQTANGVQMVRFAPTMAQRLYSTYPVGGQVSLYVVGSQNQWGGTSNYVVGLGEAMPAAGFMSPYMVSDVDLLQAEPYIMAGTRMAQFNGKLRSVVTAENGEVLGLVLDNVKLANATAMMSNTSTGAADTSGAMMGGTGGMMGGMGGMTGSVLVRVPRELRHTNTMSQVSGSMRVAQLFPGAAVEVVGYPEAPRYGVLSPFSHRVAASTMVLNGRAVGAMGVPKMQMGMKSALINTDIARSLSAEEQSAAGMGYRTYDPSGMMGGGTGTTTDSGSAGSMGTGSGTGAAGGTTGGM